MEKLDLYNEKKLLNQAIDKLKRSRITRRNKKLIMDFVEYSFARGLTTVRVVKYIFHLTKLAELLGKDFDKATKKDIQRVIAKIERENYSAWTKKDFRSMLKRFYKWLNDDKGYPEQVRWIKSTISKKDVKLPEELLTEDDIRKMVEVCSNSRDKALIFALYESGARIGEIASLKIKDVKFDEYGSIIIVKGKTGMRRVRLIASDPYLRAWLNDHPMKNDPEAPLWIKTNNEPITYSTISKLIKKIAKKAGIKKRVHAHLFRHSRATFLAQYLTEAQLSHYLGWVQGSKMASIYVHLSGRDMDKALLGIYGIKLEEKKKEEKLKPKICPRCKERNAYNAVFCSRCGLPLEIKSAMVKSEIEKEASKLISDVLRKNPKFAKVLEKLIEKEVEDQLRKMMQKRNPPITIVTEK